MGSGISASVWLPPAPLFQPLHPDDLETDASGPSLSYFDSLPYQVARFSEERAAMVWLAERRGGENYFK